MLTNHKYQSIETNWDQETILACCQKETTDDPGCTDCCYDSWQNELRRVTPEYYQAVELAGQLQSEVNFITGRRDRYKTWLDELTRAESLSADVCHQLNLIAVQSDKIWFNSCKAVEAIEILFCMIRDIYSQTDKIKSIYDSLQNCISRVNDPSLIPNQGILQSLNEYKQKLDAVIKTRDEIIKSIVEAIKLSNLIRNNISTTECPDGGDSFDPCVPHPWPCISLSNGVHYGIKTIICEWYNAFACDSDCSDTTTQQSRGNRQVPANVQQKSDCNDVECTLLPTFEFPICKNSFKQDVEGWLKNDEDQLRELIEKLNKAKIEKETLLACKTSLDSAIKATDPSLRCK
ncbi:MAG TPA: hypothetical protein VJ203_16140 [Bacteroidales bacterium]|nr:hypothetical protein [Bacteroidales bacterium]